MGELILMLPLFLIAAFSVMTWAVLSAMTVFFICKWSYQVKKHWHSDIKGVCPVLTCGVFLGSGVLTVGLETVCPYLINQPMVPVLLSVAATWIYAIAGDIQAEREKQPFKCATATPEEISERGIRCGMKDEDIEFLIKAHRTKGYRKVLAGEYGIEEGSIKDRKRRLTALLEK